jgi:hypothetical protein
MSLVCSLVGSHEVYVAYFRWLMGMLVMANARFLGKPRRIWETVKIWCFCTALKTQSCPWELAQLQAWCLSAYNMQSVGHRKRPMPKAHAGPNWSLFIPAHICIWGQSTRTSRGRMVARTSTMQPNALLPNATTCLTCFKKNGWGVRICFPCFSGYTKTKMWLECSSLEEHVYVAHG